jgi:outer membrane protein TolC
LAPPPADTLTIAAAVQIALTANPMLQAAHLSADAAAERVPQAGALPDPEVEFALMNRMVGDFGATTEPMTMNQVRVTQMLPWPGVLGNRKRSARSLAAAANLDADEAERVLVARVKRVYFELAYMDRAIATMSETRELLRTFLDVSTTMYAVGTGLQQDVLQAQVAVARMSEEITVMEQNRVAMAARLNALLGREATVPVPALELPDPSGALLPTDSLFAIALEHRPALRAAHERVAAAEAAYRAARRELYPDLMLGVSYGQRPEFEDMASLMLGVRVPLWAGARQLPMRRELQAMATMREAEALDLTNETFAGVAELRAEAERAQNLSRLYANEILPQAYASVESALSAYRVGRVDYLTLVDNEMTVNRYEIERNRLAADYQRAVAELEALVGSEVGGGP